jgi:hypothetical protein
VTLAQKHRQVGTQPGEMPILTKRPGTQRTTDFTHHLFSRLFNHGAGAAGEQFSVGLGLRIDLQRAEAQHIGCRLQCCVSRTEMGEGVRFIALRAMLTQPFGNPP